MAEMKTLTIGETTYEIFDETARNGLDGKLDASALPTAINTALAQAKARGEFDGKDGVSPTVAVSKSGKVTTISITDKNGAETATVNDGADGYTPVKDKDYFDGKNGTSVTVKSVSESTADGGSNIVTFSDGKTVTIKNGSKGDTPVRGTDYWTDADKAEIVADVMEAIDGSPEIIITENASGYWWNNNGVPEFYVPTDGTKACSKETNYIACGEGDSFKVTLNGSPGHAANGGWYDANKALISIIIVPEADYNTRTVTLTAPDGASYVRFFSIGWDNNLDNVPLDVVYLGQEETAESTSPLKGKKIVYDGDSICSSWGSSNGGSYPQIIANIVGGTFDNQGVGGGRIVTQEGSSDTFHSIVDNLVNLPTDGDLYCFEGGVNDHWHDVPLGTFSESDYTGTLDKTTYCGALETIFRYATTKFVGKPICYIITHKCPFSAFSKYGTEHTFADFRKAALSICEKYSIPVYDAWRDSGINSWNAAQLANFFIVDEDTGTGDGTHPNEAGYRRYYVPQLISLFESIMPIGVTDVENPDEPDNPTYTNLLDEAGYTKGIYLGGSGEEKTDENAFTTGYLPVTDKGTIYLKNVTMPDESGHGNRICFYKEDKTCQGSVSLLSSGDQPVTYDSSGNLVEFYFHINDSRFIRLSAWNIDETSIITYNEPIT